MITVASKNICFESARQTIAERLLCYLGSRNINNGLKAVEQLKAEGATDVVAIETDVANSRSVTLPAEQSATKPM